MYISAVINVLSSNVDQLFEYVLPTEFEGLAKKGSRIKVGFGNSNRVIMGYIIDIYDEPKFDGEKKPIIDLLDIEPLLTENQIRLANYIKDDCICPLVKILNLMIPNALVLRSNKIIRINDYASIDADLVDAFEGKNNIIYTNKYDRYKNKIIKEVDLGHISIIYDAVQSSNYLYEYVYEVDLNNYYKYGQTINSDIKYDFLSKYKDDCLLTSNEILDKYDISNYMVTWLYQKGFLKRTKRRKLRIKASDYKVNLTHTIDKGIKQISSQFQNDLSKPFLYMPESSLEAKAVLLELIKDNLDKNKNCIILSPTIAASFNFASFLRKALKIEVACINSLLSDGEYLDYYSEILANNYKIIVTTPKGAFLPYQNVGLYYLLDEENDNYYNDQSPRYDLKKIFLHESFYNHAMYILQSFSPSVTSYCYALKGSYQIVNNRKEKVHSNIKVANMLDELKRGNNSYISDLLKNALIKTKSNQRQSLLIINNKNSSNYIMCSSCGNIEKCPHCGLTLQYSEKRNKLSCPACFYSLPYEKKCSVCGSTDMTMYGIGMEGIEKNLNLQMPFLKTKVIDEIKYEELYEIMNDVEEKKIDVIITSSTYAEALNNKYISLVGVINLDSTLKAPTYDANSRAYSLLVKSYSFLNDQNGLMIIQTTLLNQPALTYFITNQYNEFIKTEVKDRRLMHSEPFYHVNRIIVKAKYDQMFIEASNIKIAIKNILKEKVFIIGPTYSKLNQGVVLIIKHNYDNINAIYKSIYELYQSKNVVVIFDKYPRKL